jgi:hypothetical protein
MRGSPAKKSPSDTIGTTLDSHNSTRRITGTTRTRRLDIGPHAVLDIPPKGGLRPAQDTAHAIARTEAGVA